MSRSPEATSAQIDGIQTVDFHSLTAEEILLIQQTGAGKLRGRLHRVVGEIATRDQLIEHGIPSAKADREQPNQVKITAEEYNFLASILGWEVAETPEPQEPDGYVEDVQRFPDDV